MPSKEVVVPRGQEAYYDNFHFAPAIKDGNRLYCSGVIGFQIQSTGLKLVNPWCTLLWP